MAQALENLDDESLMERVQKNDHQAFAVLVERRTDMFYAAAFRMLMNQHDAEDIVQEAFLKIWNKPKIWKVGKGAKFTTWFYRIVMNMSVDRLRRLSKERSVEITDDLSANDKTQEQEMALNEDQKALEAAFQILPEKQLMALNLCFYEGLSNKEAANVMKVSVKALESLLMRAKSGVKGELIREGVIEKEGEVA